MLTRYFYTCVITTALKFFNIMAFYEFGRAFGLNNDIELLQSLLAIV
jgi:hypothetical protein